MPNRILKESICTSSEIDQLSPEEEVFFYRLMVNCDDYGRIDARPQVLRARCFPLRIDKVKDKDIEKWLEKLAQVNLIILYVVEGKPYLQLTTWEKHQQVRATRSKYPALEDGVIIMTEKGRIMTDTGRIMTEKGNLISNDINGKQMISNDIKGEMLDKSGGKANQTELISNDINGDQAQSNVPVFEFDIRNTKYDNRIYVDFCNWFNEVFGRKYRSEVYKDKINARLKSFTLEQLKQACLNMRASPYMMGENDNKTVYATLEYITRNDKNVDKWLNQPAANTTKTPEKTVYR